jgi:hypothetical protein
VLAERAGRRGGVAEQEQTLEALALKVSEVYRAIFPEADASVSTLQVRSPLISIDLHGSPWISIELARSNTKVQVPLSVRWAQAHVLGFIEAVDCSRLLSIALDCSRLLLIALDCS